MSSVLKNPCSEEEVSSMFDEISHKYDFLNSLLSLNQDKRWRKNLVKALPKSDGGSLLDVATGTGDVLIACEKAKKGYGTYTGVDISANMLEHARKKIKKEKLTAKVFKESAESLKFDKCSLDCITISFGIRNVNNRDRALQLFYDSLKKDGSLLVLEFFLPEQKVLSNFFMFYFKYILPQIGGAFSSKKAYTYLPESLKSFYSSKELVKKLDKLGMSCEKEKSFIFGSCKLLVFRKK